MMNSVIKRFVKSEVFFGKQSICRKIWFLSSRFRHEDVFFTVEDERELNNPEYNEICKEYIGTATKGHRTFVIQPYLRFGKESKNTTKELKLAESVALVETLPYWTVVDKMMVSLSNLDKKEIFGAGKLQEIKTRIKCGRDITAVFISSNTLKHVQLLELEKIFGMPIYDRYSLVIHIFRSHAKSPEAKLQVALAEIPYIYKKMAELESGRINLLEKRRLYLHAREAQLKAALKKLKQNRESTRNKRKNFGYVTVAVVGYTNAGKTSLIKALTGDERMEPKNYLFATLDTTAHEGFLPCKMKILYIDTIGFIQDVPERLIEPFIATLEDALFADVIVHVYDASHPDKKAQIDHVRKTIKSLVENEKPLIEVANKCDLISPEELPEDVMGVSATKFFGLEVLRNKIQKNVLLETGHSMMRMRVESGSLAFSWLYKEATVLEANADPTDPQYQIVDVIVSENIMHRFRRFLRDSHKET